MGVGGEVGGGGVGGAGSGLWPQAWSPAAQPEVQFPVFGCSLMALFRRHDNVPGTGPLASKPQVQPAQAGLALHAAQHDAASVVYVGFPKLGLVLKQSFSTMCPAPHWSSARSCPEMHLSSLSGVCAYVERR